MLPSIEELLHRVAAQLAAAGVGKSARVAVAVSGGVDSLVLLHVLCTLHRSHPFVELLALHVNHQLRSARSHQQDLRHIERCISLFKCPLVVRSLPRGLIKRWSQRKKISIEMAARELRYGQFRRVMHHYALNTLLLAHHLDDQAETVIMRLLQGEGVMGLQGIPLQREEQWHSSQLRYLRPFHTLSKRELINYANHHHIRVNFDSTNRVPRYLRNAIRHHLIPVIQPLFPRYLNSLHLLSQQIGEMVAYIKEQSISQLSWERVAPLVYRIKVAQFCRASPLLQLYSFYRLLNESSQRQRVPRRFFDSAIVSLTQHKHLEGVRTIGEGYGIRLSLEEQWLYWKIESAIPAPLHYTAVFFPKAGEHSCLIRIVVPQIASTNRAISQHSNKISSFALLWFHCGPLNDPLVINMNIVVLNDKNGCPITEYRCIIKNKMDQIASFTFRQLAETWSVNKITANSQVTWGVNTHGEHSALPHALQGAQQFICSLPDYGAEYAAR